MQQLFSFKRFLLLIRLNFAENSKHYLISSALLIGLFIVLMTPILGSKTVNGTLSFIHLLALPLLLLGSSLFTSMAFSHYQSASKGIQAIMLPASQLEKFLAIWLINTIFLIFFLVIFWTLHYQTIAIANASLPENGRKYFAVPEEVFVFFTYWYFLIQGAIMLGAIYFNKNTYIKTAGALLITTVAAHTLNSVLAFNFTGHDVNTFPFTKWTIFMNRPIHVDFSEPIDTAVWAFLILLIVNFYIIAFVRLREKEI